MLLFLPSLLLSQHRAANTNQPLLQLQLRPHTNLPLPHTGNQRLALQSTTTTGKSMMHPQTTITDKMKTEMGTGPPAPTMSPFPMVVFRRSLTPLMVLEATMLTSLMRVLLSSQLRSHDLMEHQLQLHLPPTGQASKPDQLTYL